MKGNLASSEVSVVGGRETAGDAAPEGDQQRATPLLYFGRATLAFLVVFRDLGRLPEFREFLANERVELDRVILW